MPSLSNQEWGAVLRAVFIASQIRFYRLFATESYTQKYLFNLMNANPRVKRPAMSLAECRRTADGLARRLQSFFSCLEIALATNYIVRQHGWAATVRLGIAKDEGVKAHAWLEIDGSPVAGFDPSFQTLMTQEGRCL